MNQETVHYAQETVHYAQGTQLTVTRPWGLYCGGRAMCSDGKVRRLARISQVADTFFSVSAAICTQGTNVSGYVTVTTVSGSSTPTPDNPAIVKFHAFKNGINYDLMPEPGDKPNRYMTIKDYEDAQKKAKKSNHRDGLERRRSPRGCARAG